MPRPPTVDVADADPNHAPLCAISGNDSITLLPMQVYYCPVAVSPFALFHIVQFLRAQGLYPVDVPIISVQSYIPLRQDLYEDFQAFAIITFPTEEVLWDTIRAEEQFRAARKLHLDSTGAALGRPESARPSDVLHDFAVIFSTTAGPVGIHRSTACRRHPLHMGVPLVDDWTFPPVALPLSVPLVVLTCLPRLMSPTVRRTDRIDRLIRWGAYLQLLWTVDGDLEGLHRPADLPDPTCQDLPPQWDARAMFAQRWPNYDVATDTLCSSLEQPEQPYTIAVQPGLVDGSAMSQSHGRSMPFPNNRPLWLADLYTETDTWSTRACVLRDHGRQV
ncbi:hypothetical protein EXIGLDRAFT_406513 [Exidia glandulosa HHB12029]|uniref:Uncharacterized protein n=1 Tax=Exidia glandulosa HHB12029 TaxID=1314781 RepID=A0A165BJ30_EXIGL|nr:hypothetical protein EXIGLDRAFT_406513 [Exidia glandulosa HHB12029]